MNKKKTGIVICAAVAVLAFITALIIALSPSKAPETDTMTIRLQTAQQYLVELDYDRAIAEFEAVIQIDPMNFEAYIGLARAYEGKGDINKAVEVLEKGYEITGSEEILADLERLREETEPEPTETTTVTTTEITTTTEVTTTETTTDNEFITLDITTESEVTTTLPETTNEEVVASSVTTITNLTTAKVVTSTAAKNTVEKEDNKTVNKRGKYADYVDKYNEQGELIVKYEWKNDEPTGKTTYWLSDSGAKKDECIYIFIDNNDDKYNDKDFKLKKRTAYWENTDIVSTITEYEYVSGENIKTKYIENLENGLERYEYTVDPITMDIEKKTFYENGNLSSHSKSTEDDKYIFEKKYYENGNIHNELEYYDNGERKSLVNYAENGAVTEKTLYYSDSSWESLVYYENGEVRGRNYKYSDGTDEEWSFYENGNMRYHNIYHPDKSTEKWGYDESGNESYHFTE